MPTEYGLDQNYPNPFNPSTKIEFSIPEPAKVKIIVYNMLGQEIKTLLDEPKDLGFHFIEWNGKNDVGNQVAAGVYFYRIKANKYTKVKKMLLLK